MTPFFFGQDERRLFGILSERRAGTAPRHGVVLCNAFGREAIRAHRLYRVLADRLSRTGCDVLRFDYYGTGDSAGDDSAIDLDGFGADLRAAHAELVRRSGVSAVVWLGMRLGAVVIQRTLHEPPAGLAGVVLWDPILDGRDYLDLLRLRDIESHTAVEDLQEVAPVFRHDPTARIDEAIGFPLPRRVCDQLREFRFADLPSTPVPVTAIVDPDTAEGRAVAGESRRTGCVAVAEAAHGTDWTSEGDATGLVPPNVTNLLVERAGSLA